jgi:hypothetical protein
MRCCGSWGGDTTILREVSPRRVEHEAQASQEYGAKKACRRNRRRSGRSQKRPDVEAMEEVLLVIVEIIAFLIVLKGFLNGALKTKIDAVLSLAFCGVLAAIFLFI